MTFGLGFRFVLQGAYFIILARSLGADGYGAFAGVAALVVILAPFSGLGSEYLLVKHVARDRTLFRAYWTRALFKVAVSGILLVFATIGLSVLVLPSSVPLQLVVIIAVADLLFTRIVAVSARAFQAYQRLVHTAGLQVLLSFSRLIGVIVMVVFTPASTPVVWAWFYLGAAAITALVSMVEVHRRLGSVDLKLRNLLPELGEGFYFSASASAQLIYSNIDKAMLTRLSGLAPAGIYAAGYRLIQMAFVPVNALLEAAYPRFFQQGTKGISGTLAFVRKLLPFALTYSIIVGVVLYAISPLAPIVLGKEYAPTASVLVWLAAVPFLVSWRRMAAEALTGAGRQGWRTALEGIVVVFNVGLNFWLIPIYSWRGAAWATLASELLLASLLWVLAVIFFRTSL
jgi:O-antigen/teichoic acid export membrane protein